MDISSHSLALPTEQGAIPKFAHFNLGDPRKLEHFLSDSRVKLIGMEAVCDISSGQSPEILLLYQISPEKTSKNLFKKIYATPGSNVASTMNYIMERGKEKISNMLFSSYVDDRSRGFVFAWERHED